MRSWGLEKPKSEVLKQGLGCLHIITHFSKPIYKVFNNQNFSLVWELLLNIEIHSAKQKVKSQIYVYTQLYMSVPRQ